MRLILRQLKHQKKKDSVSSEGSASSLGPSDYPDGAASGKRKSLIMFQSMVTENQKDLDQLKSKVLILCITPDSEVGSRLMDKVSAYTSLFYHLLL
jgi:hypothetical protein